MRAIWKGHIRFSLVTIPIRIYNAVDNDQTIRFNQLHKEDHGPIGYDKRCKKCQQIVKQDEIVKGYPYEPDQYVIVTPEDLEKIRLKSTKIIEISGFIEAGEVHPALYESPYFAGPDGPVASKTYALLVETLRASGKVGVGKVVLRDREDAVLIAPQGPALVLYKLRNPKEIRKIDNVPQLEELKTSKDELKLALNLVESMATHLSEVDLTDRYMDALREMIEAKIAGKEVVSVEEAPREVVDIMTALKESIEQAKAQKKPMEKATGPKKAVTSDGKALKVKKRKSA